MYYLVSTQAIMMSMVTHQQHHPHHHHCFLLEILSQKGMAALKYCERVFLRGLSIFKYLEANYSK
ncbi:MAG: hypothetical protein ACI8RD_013502 [Bacillariaceae sp.]|jgi:hypothetical protein